MKTIKIAALAAVAFGFSACSGQKSVVNLDRVGEEDVLTSHGDKSLMDAAPFKIDGDTVYATALVSSPADGYRQEALLTMSYARCRAVLAKTIQAKLEAYLQLSQQNAAFDSSDMREVISEVSKVTANDWRPTGQFIQKVKVISDGGLPRTEYRVWTQLSLESNTFKRQVVNAMREQEGHATMAKDFAKSVSTHWSSVLNGQEQKADRKAASVEEPAQDDE